MQAIRHESSIVYGSLNHNYVRNMNQSCCLQDPMFAPSLQAAIMPSVKTLTTAPKDHIHWTYANHIHPMKMDVSLVSSEIGVYENKHAFGNTPRNLVLSHLVFLAGRKLQASSAVIACWATILEGLFEARITLACLRISFQLKDRGVGGGKRESLRICLGGHHKYASPAPVVIFELDIAFLIHKYY